MTDEQKQTVTEIRERHQSTLEGIENGAMRIGMPTAIVAHNDRTFLLEIIDDLQKEVEQLKQLDGKTLSELARLRVEVENITEECEFARHHLQISSDLLKTKNAEIEQLTKERDEARKMAEDWRGDMIHDSDLLPWENRPLTQQEIDEMREAISEI